MSSRSGAALVIAIVVLAAMLLLGLPFLFTQSGSLSGTRSYANGRLASIGQDSAQSMGIAAGASAMSYRWQQNGVTQGGVFYLDDWTDLFHGIDFIFNLGGPTAPTGLRRVGVNRIEFDTRNHTFALPGDQFLNGLPAAERDPLLQRYPTVVGLTIEDESGKLDPNHLDTIVWSRLLANLGIQDWTDGPPMDDPGRMQIARALANLRYRLPGGRITAIDQLLLAEPPTPVVSTSNPSPRPRRGLTRAELERLRPYLTLANPAQARGGLIDLGTVIGVDVSRVTLDHDQPGALLAFAPAPLLIGSGTGLRVSDGDDSFAMPAQGEAPRQPAVGAAVGIEAPPVVNLHQAEQPVRQTFAPGQLPSPTPPTAAGKPPTPSLLTELQSFPALGVDALQRARTAFNLTAPLVVISKVGSTHVLCSKDSDPVPGPFDSLGQAVDPDFSGTPADPIRLVLHRNATVIRVVTGSLDRFPTRGYAILKGINADTNAADQELIQYTSTVLPLGTAVAATQVVTLVDVVRGVDFATGLPSDALRKNFHSGTDSTRFDQPADLHLDALATIEQHPVGIASQGVISIASTSTVTDPVGNQTAQEQHRVVAQALPQETALEARWDKQAALHALLAQRHGSLMTSFPRPHPRLSDVMPQDAANVTMPGNVRYEPPLNVNDLDRSVGLRPAAMRTLLSLNDVHLRRDWTLAFGGNAANALLAKNPGSSDPGVAPVLDAATDPYSANDITPEGLRLTANRVLVYPNPGQGGFLRDDFTQAASGAPGALSPIRGRQFSLWVRPDEDWTGQVALLDMRVPNGNVGKAYNGTINETGAFDGRTEVDNNLVSNRFSLIYDQRVNQLILVLNPGIIPFAPVDGMGNRLTGFGPLIPRETYGTVAVGSGLLPLRSNIYPAVNPECLGSGGVNPMSCASPITTIQHRYHLGPASWTRGQWRLIQVAFSSNQPGGMSIIVDGLVGRDVSGLGGSGTPRAMTQAGDHLTLPSLVLRTPLAAASVKDDGAQAMYVNEIQLDGCAPTGATMVTGAAAVEAILPARGIVRIGTEYISYQAITDGKLINCVRARRQRTDAGMTGNTVDWDQAHQMRAHADGDPVVPGGFAIANQSATWWRGGCLLKETMPDGDPANRYQTWAVVAENAPINSPSVKLTGTFRTDFPPRGFVMIAGTLYFYDNTSGMPPLPQPSDWLVNLWHWGRTTIPDPMDASKTIEIDGWESGLKAAITATSLTKVVLASVELEGDPTPGNSYKRVIQSGNPYQSVIVPNDDQQDYQPAIGLIQLYDQRSATTAANGGRAEWLAYTSIDSRTDYPTSRPPVTGGANERMSFLLNLMLVRTSVEPETYELRPGFWFDFAGRTGARGRQRTAFAATDFVSYSPALRFPAKTRVIPVQTEIPIAYLLEAGDIITLAPKVLSGTQRPLQMCVRYSAADAFPESLTSPGYPWNVMNRFFAFTEPLPPATEWNPGNQSFHMLCWPCWTPDDDLSPINSNQSWLPQRLGWVLPWANAFYPDYQPTGAPDERRLRLFNRGNNIGLNATIDGVQAGNQPGWVPQSLGGGGAGANVGNTQVHVVAGPTLEWLDANPLGSEREIRTDQPIFFRSHGLIEIGGEVFAYKTNFQQDEDDVTAAMNPDPVRNNQAWLIGRALLGSVARRHQGPELVLHLPVGPVAEVVDGLGGTSGPVNLDGDFANATVLLTARNGEDLELASLPNRHTASWLRGLYNTTPVDWVAKGAATAIPSKAPLAIAWWPRYPSVYPKDMLTSDTVAEFLRCRSYAWAGFPLRFHDCLFTGKNNGEIVNLSDDGGFFHLHGAALDGSLDWGAASVIAPDETPGTARIDISDVFDGDRFRAPPASINRWLKSGTVRPTNGAELRVFWLYRSAPLTMTGGPIDWLLDAADHGNRAPMLGPAYLRTRAPNKVLNVER